MKFYTNIILSLLLVSFGTVAQRSTQESGIKTRVDLQSYTKAVKSVQQKIAPSRRIAVFDVIAVKAGSKIVLKGEVENSEAAEAVMDAVRKVGGAEIIDSIIILPEQSCREKPFARINVSVAPLRAQPAESAEMVTQALMGSVVKVLKLKKGWMYVQMIEDNYLGWIDNGQCVRQTQEQVDRWKDGSLIIITAYIDLVRMQPSESAQPVCDVTAMALLSGKEFNTEWFAVSLPDGRSGYLPKKSGMDYARWKETRNPTQENIENTAKTFLGVPYIWGGTSPKGFDCSGFAQTVYKLNGIILQRDADQQGAAGKHVPMEEDLSMLQKGDLLFFGSQASREGPERITHVGIYLGQKEFIHCSSLVKFNSFDPSSPFFNEYLLHRLVKVKRFLPDK